VRLGREDELSAPGSGPAYVEESERRLSAAQPCETRDRRTPSRKGATVSAQDGGAPIAVGAAIAPSAGGNGAVGVSQLADGLSDRTAIESTLKLSKMAMPATEPIAPPADPAEASSSDQASQPTVPTAELIGVRAEMVEAAAAEESQAIADPFAQAGGNGPEKGIVAAEPVVIEATPAVEAANLHAHETGVTEATKRGSEASRFKALVRAVSLAMVGAAEALAPSAASSAG
jgi:hypothetical protein